MKYFFTSLFFLITANLYSQSSYQYWQWAKSYGGQGNDITSDIKVKNGFIYVTGTFTSPAINWENTSLVNNGNRDIFIAKLDTSGNTIWVKNFGGTANDSVSQLEINNNGVFVLLCKSSSANINLGSVQLINPTNFYAKFDTDGNLLKAQVLPGSLTYNDIDIGNDGSIYTACNFSHQEFTFANTLVDTLMPTTPPTGAPVVFVGSSYYYINPQDIVYYTSGSALLKYDSTGAESWVKVYHATAPNLLIAYDNNTNTIATLLQHNSAVDLDGTYHYQYGTFFAPASLLLAGISANSGIIYANDNVGAVSNVYGFQIDNMGLGFLSFSTHTYGFIGNYPRVSNFRNGSILRSVSTSNYNYFPGVYNYLPFDISTMGVGENGHSIFNSITTNNNIFVFDSSFRLSDSIVVPDGGQLTLHDRVIAKKAFYFADHFNGNTLVLPNDSAPSLPSFNLQGQGGNDIFIGKFYSRGYLPIALNIFKDTFKFCNGNTNVNLDSSTIINRDGAGNLSYQWSPALNFSNPNSLSTSVTMTTDTLVSTLTITDAAGDSISKNIVFYNGIQSDVHLMLSNTEACSNTFINAFLSGTLLDTAYIQDQCYLYKYPFNSLNAVSEIYVGNCPGLDTFRLLSNSTKYCFDTTPVILQINPTYSTYNLIYICQGSNYTFPNDTTILNITADYRRVRYLQTAKGCDSTSVTDLVILSATPQTINDSATICSGSSYTFPDGTIQNNIQSNTSHKSILKAAGGCDSAYIDTYLAVIQGYSQTVDISACAGGSYGFPDSTYIHNIQNSTSHSSHLYTVNGCDSIIITNLSVSPSYSQTINDSVCAGSTYIFPDSFYLTNVQTDFGYLSRLKTMQGCDSLILTNLHVYRLDTGITKTNATLKANLNGATYQWFDCSTFTPVPGETGQSFSANLIGNYAVQLYKNGCIDTSICYPVSYSELIKINNTDVSIYPNPASETLTIKFISEVPTTLNVNLYNSNGSSVLLYKFSLVAGANNITLNISALQKGVYALSLFSNYKQEKIIRKIVIN